MLSKINWFKKRRTIDNNKGEVQKKGNKKRETVIRAEQEPDGAQGEISTFCGANT